MKSRDCPEARLFLDVAPRSPWTFAINITSSHLHWGISLHQEVEDSSSGQVQCFHSFELFCIWFDRPQNLLSFSSFPFPSKQCKSATTTDFCASASVFQVHKLIHWDSTCKVKSLHCCSQHANTPSTQPNPPGGRPRCFKLLHNPWADLVTAAYTWRDSLCEVTGPLICICFVYTPALLTVDVPCDFTRFCTSSTSHSWSPHFTSFL